MATENWELQNKPKNVSLRARTLLPEDLGQLVSALLRDSRRSKPLPGDVFEQVCRAYENTTLAHPAFAGEIDRYMDIAREKVASLLSKNLDPALINLGDFPQPNFDLNIIQRAQQAAILRYVGKQISQSSDLMELPKAPWRTVYDAKSGLLCTMDKKDEQKPEVCYAFLPDIVLPPSAQFSEIADTTIYIMPITQKGVKKMAYISSSSAHEIGVSEIEEHHGVVSFRTWGDTPRVAIPNPERPGEYIHEEGALEGVFGGDIVVIKTQNSLVVRDASGVFRCEVPSNFTPTVEKDGIRLAHSIDTTANVWSKDNSTEPLAKLNCNTGFLSFSDFREIARQGS